MQELSTTPFDRYTQSIFSQFEHFPCHTLTRPPVSSFLLILCVTQQPGLSVRVRVRRTRASAISGARQCGRF